MPHDNPCAQCGRPIAFPEWIEERDVGAAYLWHCSACDYRFEAVAFVRNMNAGQGALAA